MTEVEGDSHFTLPPCVFHVALSPSPPPADISTQLWKRSDGIHLTGQSREIKRVFPDGVKTRR